MTKIYLASIYERRAELQEYMRRIEAAGFKVTSRWLMHDFDDSNWAAQAIIDLEDIQDCDGFIVFTEEKGYKGRGGKDFETGYALALGKPIAVVGPVQHQFYCIFDEERLPLAGGAYYRTESIEEMLKAFEENPGE